MVIKELTLQECAAMLRAARVGHLACANDGQPYVVPITIAFDDHHVYSFSLPGHKVDCMRANPKVSLIVDERGQGGGWKSVIVQGSYEELPDRIGTKRERDHAWSMLSKHANWWEPGGLKPVAESVPPEHLFFRIHIGTMTGRQAMPE